MHDVRCPMCRVPVTHAQTLIDARAHVIRAWRATATDIHGTPLRSYPQGLQRSDARRCVNVAGDNARAPCVHFVSVDTSCMPAMATIERARLRALVAAGIALSSELTLDDLLQQLVESAAALTGARYAALGFIDAGGHELERFITHGMDADEVQRIGDLPRGRGMLGILIQDAKPLRLHDLGEDSRSVGFPANHPPMRGFLGVPVVLRGVAYGNLYLTEKAEGADFDSEDEDLVGLLAAQAAVAIENARLFEAARRWSDQLEALNEVGNALATEIELPRLLNLTARRLRELIDARLIAIALPRADGTLAIEAADGERAEEILGIQLEPAGSKSGRVLERRRSERVDRLLEDTEVDYGIGRPIGARTGLYVPLIVRDRAIGVIVAHDKSGDDPRFTPEDQRLAETFAARAAVAVDQSRRVASDALRAVVEAQELERQRLARELHDQTGQELISVLLGLKAVEDAAHPGERERALTRVREQVVETLQDVRRLAVELRPKALDDFGLVAALERLGETFRAQTGLALDLEAQLWDERLSPEIETALYRMVQEALTNVTRHARARSVSIVLRRDRGAITAIIEDDGCGFDPGADCGTGLQGMRERLALIGGKLKVESRPGGGTTLVASVPR
jgi:signal transduction histidine kinase